MAGTSATENFTGRRFRLLRTLGEGTFGVVYLAELVSQGGFRKQVALKLLNQSWDPEADAGRRLRDEARLLGRLNHRHIVRVDDLVRITGRWGLVMEYIEGADLDAVIEVAKERGIRLPVRAIVEIGVAVAEALHAARNAAGDDGRLLAVVHRDIKPSNVLLSEAGDIKVLDFGVARAEFSGREAKTERVRYGSMGYMSPERILGGEGTFAGDIYALGVVLYELLLLQPFGRAELTADAHRKKLDFARAYLMGALTRAGATENESSSLANLVEECLAFDPEARPEAIGVAQGLRVLLRGMPGDDITPFARAFVPVVRERLGPGTLPIPNQEIREDVAGGVATFVFHTETTAAGILVTPVEPRPSSLPLFLIAGFLGLALALVGGWFLIQETSENLPETKVSVEKLPVAAPPAEPSPTTSGTAPIVPPSTGQPSTLPPSTGQPSPLPPSTVHPPTATSSTGQPSTLPSFAVPKPPPTARPPEAVPSTQPPEVESDAPILRAVKFGLSGASGLKVRCGASSQTGETSVLFRDLPAGPCVVSSGALSTTVSVNEPRGFSCVSDGVKLECH